MANLTLGEKIKQIRKGLRLNQTEFAKLLGFKFPTAVSKFEDNARIPDTDKLKIIAELGKTTLDALLAGNEQIAQGKNQQTQRETYIDPPRHPAAAMIPSPGSGPPGINPAIQAMSDVKEIFDSGDPILVPAIQANLNAFKRALQRERQFAQVIQENKDLKERISKLEILCEDLKKQIESFKSENQELREEIKELKRTSGGCPPIDLGIDHAARTGTDDLET